MEFKTVFTSVRSARIAVFIDSSDSDWQDSALRIIEFFATLWGGKHSIIVPTDGKAIAPEFWAILESFDPDYLFYYEKSAADLKIAKPQDYEALLEKEVAKWRAQSGSEDAAGTRKMIDKELVKAAISRFGLSPDLRDEINRRLVPFARHGGGIGAIRAESSAFWPLTGIADLLPFSEHPPTVANVHTNIATLPPVWYAAALGGLHQPHTEALVSAGMRTMSIQFEGDEVAALFNLTVTGRDRLWNLPPSAQPSSARAFPFALTMAELSLYQTIDGASDIQPFTVIVGDALDDFCLYYDLPRLGRPCGWLLWSWVKSSRSAVARFKASGQRIREEEQLAGFFGRALNDHFYDQAFERVRFWSTSLRQDQIELAIQSILEASLITPSPIRGAAEPLRPEDLAIKTPPQPRNSRNAWRPVTVPVDGDISVSRIETPTPTGFSSVNPGKHRWITELTVRSHEYPKHRALGPWLLRIEGYSDREIRTTKDGLAYFCPGNLILQQDQDLNLFVVRPNIYIPGAFDVVSFLLERSAKTCRISDKGYYAQHSIQKFGGLDQLAGALRDAGTGKVLRKFLDHAKRGHGVMDEGVYLNADRRAYLDLRAASKLVGDEATAVNLLDALVTRGVLQRGFILHCAVCRDAYWYSLNALSQRFECRRCEHSQVFTREHWKDPAQPNLFYRLDEIVFQGLVHDMAVPVQTLDHLRKKAKRAFDFSPEIEVWATGAQRPTMEVDICCLMDGSLIIGEAKTADVLDKSRKGERTIISKYQQAASDLGASAVVFATISPTWDPGTIQEITKSFSSGNIKPIVLTASEIS